MTKRKNGTTAVMEPDTEHAPVSNDGETTILAGMPYVARVTIEGVCPILFHRYSVESVAEKAAAPKNSKTKKTDDIESYVYRNSDGLLCIEGAALKAALCMQGKSIQDPRSPRKSAHDLYKAIIVPLTDMAPLERNGKTTSSWDFVDTRRVVVQRNGVPRSRPAMHPGWRATFELMVQAPEYLGDQQLNALIQQAGRFQGLLDYRPTYGRFQVVQFEVLKNN